MPIEFKDTYEFGDVMFDGSIPVMKNGERMACIHNTEMIEPSNINANGGKVIKTPCHKGCVAMQEATITNTESNESKTGYALQCFQKPFFIEIRQKTKLKLER